MKILVIGDAILDKYIWGAIRRQSPEDATVPVVDFVDQEYRLGGCLNVAANVKSLSKRGVEVFVSSIMSDYTGNLLKEKKISYDEIVLKTKEEKKPHERELIKTRIVNSENLLKCSLVILIISFLFSSLIIFQILYQINRHPFFLRNIFQFQ